ncbi:hypothetical protein ACS0TY_028791 [Phlomoides rotata]
MYLPNNHHNQTNDQINKHKEVYQKKRERESKMTNKPPTKGQSKSQPSLKKTRSTPSTWKTYIKATATRAAAKAVPPMAALLIRPLLSAGVLSAEGPAVGEPGAGPPGPEAGASGEVGEAVGAILGVAVDGDGDGDGVAVGDATGAGVGVAAGETVGAPDGAWAMHEVAKSAKRRKSLTPCDEAIVGERETILVRFGSLEIDKGRLKSEDIYKKSRERD